MIPEPKAEVAALKERRAARQAEREKAAADLEVEELRLEDRLEGEAGARGVEFEIVKDERLGIVIGVRREPPTGGGAVLYKRFMAANAGTKEAGPEDIAQYVTACIAHPEKPAFLALLERYPHLGMRCANALMTLHGAKEADARGKF